MSQVTEFQIQGMHCGACVRRVTTALEKVPGVAVQNVIVGSATVETEEAQQGAAEVIAALHRIGFEATAVHK